MKKFKEKRDMVEHLSSNYQDVTEFSYDSDTYTKNTKVREYLNKLLSANIRAVYSTTPNYDTKYSLDWSGDRIIIINAKYEVISMTNSEWAFISKL